MTFLEKYNILNKYQFGIRKGHSTEQAILEITENLKTSIDNNLITCGVFIDFSKAFDMVNHEILLAKLFKYGIRGHEWFNSYLTNRQHFVQIDNIQSSTLTMTCGVPQGSTLGPLLFLIYINDIVNCSSILSFRLFTDDTNIFYVNKDPTELEIVMNCELKKLYMTTVLSINYLLI
jgi:retron-type reverse transcriptase